MTKSRRRVDLTVRLEFLANTPMLILSNNYKEGRGRSEFEKRAHVIVKKVRITSHTPWGPCAKNLPGNFLSFKGVPSLIFFWRYLQTNLTSISTSIIQNGRNWFEIFNNNYYHITNLNKYTRTIDAKIHSSLNFQHIRVYSASCHAY